MMNGYVHHTKTKQDQSMLRILLLLLLLLPLTIHAEPEPEQICYDVPDWIDAQGDGCDWYAEGENCRLYGTNEDFSNQNHMANTACCACGGGFIGPNTPTGSPSMSVAPTILVTEDPIVTCGIGQVTAPSGLCVDPVCEDIPWVDSMNNDCSSYEGRCETDGNEFFSEGHVANTACCICSGGVNKEDTVEQEASGKEWFTENYNNLTLPASNPTIELCVDFFNFTVADFNYTCADFVAEGKSGVSCSRYGFYQDNFSGETASNGCCVCNQESGYRGDLIGEKFRVGVLDEQDYYYLTEDENGDTMNGTLVVFMRSVARTYGFGLYAQNTSDESLALFGVDVYAACLYDLYMGYLDICIGNFPKDMGVGLYSQPLFTEEYFLVVPIYRQTFLGGLFTPFLPFTPAGWIVVIAAIIYMSVIFSIITDDFDQDDLHERSTNSFIRSCFKKYFSFNRCCHSFYSGLRSFTALDVQDASEEPTRSEKIIISGFVIFALVVITAYTATAATALYVAYQYEYYSNLGDVLMDSKARICVEAVVRNNFLLEHPEASDFVVDDENVSWMHPSQMIYEVGKGLHKGFCDVALVTTLQFSNAAFEYEEVAEKTSTDVYSSGRTFCESLSIFSSEAIFEVENSFVLSESMGGNKSHALLDGINLMLEYGYFSAFDSFFYEEYVTRQKEFLDSIANDDVWKEIGNSFTRETRKTISDASIDSTTTKSYGRLLKGGGKATSRSGSGTVSSSSSGASNICTTDNKLEEKGLYQLAPYHLAMPIVITVFCSTLGLIVFLIEKSYNRYITIRKQKELNEKQKLAKGDLYMTKEMVDTEFDMIFTSLQYMRTNDIWEELKRCTISEITINKAINKLPDRGALLRLLTNCKLSSNTKEFKLISKLEISELCRILSEMAPNEDGDKGKNNEDIRELVEWKSIVNSSDDPKTELVERLVNDPIVRYLAITRVMCLEEDDDEIEALLCGYHNNNYTFSNNSDVEAIPLMDAVDMANSNTFMEHTSKRHSY